MNFNERIAELAELDRRVGYWDWSIDEQWDHHVLYDDGYAFSVCETESADALPTHAAFIVALRNKALPLLREMQDRIADLEDDYLYASSQDQMSLAENKRLQAENERLRAGIKNVAAKFAEMEKLRSQFYTEKEQAETALLFANRENKKLREGIGRALFSLNHAKEIDAQYPVNESYAAIAVCVLNAMKELEALQNDA